MDLKPLLVVEFIFTFYQQSLGLPFSQNTISNDKRSFIEGGKEDRRKRK